MKTVCGFIDDAYGNSAARFHRKKIMGANSRLGGKTLSDTLTNSYNSNELIEHGAKAVVLSKGIWERLNVCPETLEVLAKNGIEVEVLQTEAAVERFNELRESMPVGGLFHSTC